MVLRALLVVAMLWPVSAAGQTRSGDPAAAFIEQLEQAAATGSVDAVMALGATPEASGVRMFAALAVPKPTRFIIKERDRAALEPEGEVLLLEVFGEYGTQATITTWRAELVPLAGDGNARRITEIEELTTVSGLYKLGLNPAKQFELRNLTVQATDLKLEIPSGSAFVAETPEGPTAIVLLGRGRMTFSPSDAAERTQVRIFSGEDALATEFDAVLIRVRPGEVDDVLPAATLKPVPVAAGDFRRASDFFDDTIGQTFNLDLRDLSRERWSLIPPIGDLLAEVRTRRLGTLTYARSTKRCGRHLAVRSAAAAEHRRLRLGAEAGFARALLRRRRPRRLRRPASGRRSRLFTRSDVDRGNARRSSQGADLRARDTDPPARRIARRAQRHGRRLRPAAPPSRRRPEQRARQPAGDGPRNGIIRFTVVYGGRLEPQQIEREGIVLDQQASTQQEEVYIPLEPQYLYSNRSYWYPQNTVTDYAISRLASPSRRSSMSWRAASRAAARGGARAGAPGGRRARKLFVFEAAQPLRYLACAISRFTRVTTRDLLIGAENDPIGAKPVKLTVQANPRQATRARAFADRAAAIYEYYGRLTRRRAVPERSRWPSPRTICRAATAPPISPSSISRCRCRRSCGATIPSRSTSYPPFFLAHELAHQWWGQAVGWKNYHEQWISEGFAQYFAALYAEQERGDEVVPRRAAADAPLVDRAVADQGPVYLGYRLGHIKDDGRVFRALVYNKGAMVLHMLRRLVGDEAFFSGLRRSTPSGSSARPAPTTFALAMEKRERHAT